MGSCQICHKPYGNLYNEYANLKFSIWLNIYVCKDCAERFDTLNESIKLDAYHANCLSYHVNYDNNKFYFYSNDMFSLDRNKNLKLHQVGALMIGA